MNIFEDMQKCVEGLDTGTQPGANEGCALAVNSGVNTIHSDVLGEMENELNPVSAEDSLIELSDSYRKELDGTLEEFNSLTEESSTDTFEDEIDFYKMI